MTDYHSTITTWHSGRAIIRNTFGRQALPMTWDFTEANPFSNSTGNWGNCIGWGVKTLEALRIASNGTEQQSDAQTISYPEEALISTDPPLLRQHRLCRSLGLFLLLDETSAPASLSGSVRRACNTQSGGTRRHALSAWRQGSSGVLFPRRNVEGHRRHGAAVFSPITPRRSITLSSRARSLRKGLVQPAGRRFCKLFLNQVMLSSAHGRYARKWRTG